VIPFLRSRRIPAVDALVLSHGDIDHVSGAEDLVAALPVGRVHGPGALRRGDRIEVPGARIEVLWPPPGRGGGNDGSTVLFLRTAGLTALLAGDLEEEGIRGLLTTPGLPRPDVLLLPHHGRPAAGAAALVRRLVPGVLVASNGPADPVDAAYSGVWLTSEHGAIEVRPGPKVTTFRPR
jgi:competence protein ComEC